MSSKKVSKEYLDDRIDVIQELKEEGRVVTLIRVVSSGEAWKPNVEYIEQKHYAIPVKIDRRDIKGNIKATDSKYFIDADNSVYVGMRFKDKGKTGEVISVDESIGFDAETIIAYYAVVRI